MDTLCLRQRGNGDGFYANANFSNFDKFAFARNRLEFLTALVFNFRRMMEHHTKAKPDKMIITNYLYL